MFRRRVRIFYAPDEGGGGGGAQGSAGGDAGTSTGSGSEGAVGQGQGQQGQQGTPPQGGGQPDPYAGNNLSLGDDFLQRVDPAHRPILENYVKQWDAGVTRRFQELHSQLQPYQQLGLPPQELQAAVATYQLLDQNPQAIYDILKSELEGGSEQGQEGQGGEEGDPFQGVSPAFKQQFQQMQQALEALAQHTLNSQTTSQQQQEDAQLDQYLGLLKQEYGDFDEDYVLAKMAKGMDGAAAVQAFSQLGKPRPGTGGGRPPLAVLSGGGSVPADAQNVTKASRKDTKSLVASLLQQAHEQGS